jgi:signal transduction histidine kinase
MLLDKSLMENGQFQPQFEPAYLYKIIRETIEILKGQAKTKKLDIIFNPPSEDIFLKVDEMRIQQVLMNLLSNAIKFSTA